VEFHHYLVGSQTDVLEHDSGKDVPGGGIYQLRLCGGNKMLLHDTLHAPRVQCSVVSFVS